jgi:DNA (cytosine-5)-methyltransferase 1
MRAYYNEFDPYAAQWLRNLISAGLIASGDVDDRSIADVQPSDLEGYTQCHFFAGIGGWSLALRLAGWTDDRPVWTGSCPCQPFSIAGKVEGVKDERHLWPEWFRLIRKRKPSVVFGEQIASSAGRQWLAGVHLEMESAAYSFGAGDLCAASVKAKHPRQRLIFVADASSERLARSVPYGEGLRSGESSPSAKHRDAGLRARVCFEPDPGTLVRIDGLPRPVGQVRAFGNAIVPQIAAEVIAAFMDVRPDLAA